MERSLGTFKTRMNQVMRPLVGVLCVSGFLLIFAGSGSVSLGSLSLQFRGDSGFLCVSPEYPAPRVQLPFLGSNRTQAGSFPAENQLLMLDSPSGISTGLSLPGKIFISRHYGRNSLLGQYLK